MRTAQECAERLEASELLRRREWATANTKVMAQAQAAWYLSAKFVPRWGEK